MGKIQVKDTTLYNDAREIILNARSGAVRSVEFTRLIMYWHLGERIFNEEQRGQDRAEYGEYLIRDLSKELEKEFGSGFSYTQLTRARKFYRTYPNVKEVRPQLNWSQYRQLIAIEDDYKREYYELESANQAWTARETERQINSSLYERLLLSNDKESVLAVAHKQRIPEMPTEIIKDPMYLEFLGLKREASYYEEELEDAIITHLQAFLLEMGKGFAFMARQQRILLEDDEYFVDLVCYNRLLRCFVLFEIIAGLSALYIKTKILNCNYYFNS